MPGYEKYTDFELIKLLKNSDEKAFEVLYYRYVPKLSSFINFYFGRNTSSEESIQEAFIKIWEKRDTLDESKSINAYLIEIVKNLVYNSFRSKIQEEKYKQYQKTRTSGINDIEDYINHKELEEQIKKSITTLPPMQKEIFIMSREKGMNHEEIAKHLNISKRTVEHQIYRALKTLKKCTFQDHLYLSLLLYFLIK